MHILGISAYYHDSAAALISDGEVVGAAQEERFLRQKHCAAFPTEAVRYVLDEAGIEPSQVDSVVFYDKPLRKLNRLVASYLSYAPKGSSTFGRAFEMWSTKKGRQRSELRRELDALGFGSDTGLLFSSHHESHAASAFYVSPFESAAVLTMDGVGEWATTTVGRGDGSDLEMISELRFPHSIGLLYSAFTDFTGFKVNSAEYKVMGLAPYGEPKYAQLILDKMIDLKDDGSYRLNMEYFDFAVGDHMTSTRFHEAIGGPPREPEDLLTQRDMDLAASVQVVTEEVVLRIARWLRESTGEPNLCLAGGVSLNCVANGKLVSEGIFDDVWVQPAAGDAGGALGAALLGYHRHHGRPRPSLEGRSDRMSGSYLGPGYDDDEIERQLTEAGAVFERLPTDQMLERTVRNLAEGKAIGWFQGRMEFGPRALGNRSIIADPRDESMQRTLNLKVKFRESFRPFAPSILREDLADYFEFEHESPYMLMVGPVRESIRTEAPSGTEELFGIEKLMVPRSSIPAVTHVDYSARIQTVTSESNPLYHQLLSGFKTKTGCPVLVNTSFNVRGEPIVCTPQDAYRCFMGTELDSLVVGNFVLEKVDQDPSKIQDYRDEFELD